MAINSKHIGTGTAGFQQEGVAIVEEVHASVSQAIDGGNLAAQRGLHGQLEAFRLFGHHALRLLQGIVHWIVATSPGVVERSLVTAQVYLDVFFSQALPEVNNIAHVCHGEGLMGLISLISPIRLISPIVIGATAANLGDHLVEIAIELVHPSLVEALLCCLGVDFGGDAYHAGNIGRFRLGTAHAS